MIKICKFNRFILIKTMMQINVQKFENLLKMANANEKACVVKSD
jgi:hypothetical protein